MNNDNTLPEIVKSKKPSPELISLWWNSPPGEFPTSANPSTIYLSKEWGYSSKKLTPCGDVWYLEEYFDTDGRPVKFLHGSRKARDKNSRLFSALKLWAEQDCKGDFPDIPDCKKPEKVPYTDEQKCKKGKINRGHSKRNMRQYVNRNKLTFMGTLTFALRLHKNVPGLRMILPEEKQRDRKEVERVWHNRLGVIRKHLRSMGIDFKFVKVLEKHDSEKTSSRKRGTYHIHFATDRWVDEFLLQRLWGYGTADMEDFNRPRPKGTRGKNDPGRGVVVDPGMYMSKYMEKDFDDAELHGYQKAFSRSQNLKKPVPERDESVINGMLQKKQAESHVVFDKTCDVEYMLGDKPIHIKKRLRIMNFRPSAENWSSCHAITQKVSRT